MVVCACRRGPSRTCKTCKVLHIGGDKDRQLKKLWTETRIGSILPWDDIEDEAERLLESDGVTGQTSKDTHADQDLGDDQ